MFLANLAWIKLCRNMSWYACAPQLQSNVKIPPSVSQCIHVGQWNPFFALKFSVSFIKTNYKRCKKKKKSAQVDLGVKKKKRNHYRRTTIVFFLISMHGKNKEIQTQLIANNISLSHISTRIDFASSCIWKDSNERLKNTSKLTIKSIFKRWCMILLSGIWSQCSTTELILLFF